MKYIKNISIRILGIWVLVTILFVGISGIVSAEFELPDVHPEEAIHEPEAQWTLGIFYDETGCKYGLIITSKGHFYMMVYGYGSGFLVSCEDFWKYHGIDIT